MNIMSFRSLSWQSVLLITDHRDIFIIICKINEISCKYVIILHKSENETHFIKPAINKHFRLGIVIITAIIIEFN